MLYVPFPGGDAYWYENPGAKGGPWKRHLALHDVGNESPCWSTSAGDGRQSCSTTSTGYLGYATYDPAKPDDPWVFHAITPKNMKYGRFTHGIGCGDIKGEGRMDIVEAGGWWEHPAEIKPDRPWKFHPFKFADQASQMLVYDVDGDGLADVICVLALPRVRTGLVQADSQPAG